MLGLIQFRFLRSILYSSRGFAGEFCRAKHKLGARTKMILLTLLSSGFCIALFEAFFVFRDRKGVVATKYSCLRLQATFPPVRFHAVFVMSCPH